MNWSWSEQGKDVLATFMEATSEVFNASEFHRWKCLVRGGIAPSRSFAATLCSRRMRKKFLGQLTSLIAESVSGALIDMMDTSHPPTCFHVEKDTRDGQAW
jgi:hypothetical protein